MANSVIVPSALQKQALAFPSKVDQFIAKNPPMNETSEAIAQGEGYRKYLRELDASKDLMRPLSFGLLKLRAHAGTLMPPGKPGRGNKTLHPGVGFSPTTLSAYRKLAANVAKLDEYYESTDDVPTQSEFLNYANGVHVSNNSGEVEWYTPAVYVEAARIVLGGIDLDPASSKVAQKTIKAERWFSKEQNGLSQPWAGRLWLNPPYGKTLIEPFVKKLLESPDARPAICLVNNATETAWCQSLLVASDACCFPQGRIKYNDATGQPANSPLQGQLFCYFGDGTSSFRESFEQFGVVLK